MIVSVNDNERIVIKTDSYKEIAYLDDNGIPIITPEFFKLKASETQKFWELVNRFRGEVA